MEDEEFGEDVLVTTRADEIVVKDEAKTEESRVTWESSKEDVIKSEKKDEDEDEDEELYGGVSIKLNASATSQNEAEADSSVAAKIEASSEVKDEPVVDSDDDEDDEDVAIVLNTDHANKPTLRFTGGGNRYVRGSFPSQQLGASGTSSTKAMTSAQIGESSGSTMDGLDDMTMFGGRRTAFDVDIDLLEDRPWRKPGVDISDYFNYGFDEHSWREYATRQLRLRRELAVEKSREQASRQAVNAANQQAMRERDAKLQGRGGGGLPPRGYPGPMKGEGEDEQPGEWGAGGNGMPSLGSVPPRGFMPPRGWHPDMGPPLGFMGQQNWNGPPMGAAPWCAVPGRGPPLTGGPGGGRGNFGDRGTSGKDDWADKRGGRSREASRDRSKSRDRHHREASRNSGRRDGSDTKDTSDKDRGRDRDRDRDRDDRRDRGRERERERGRDGGRERDRGNGRDDRGRDRDRNHPREREGRGTGEHERERNGRNRVERGTRSRSRDRDSRKRKGREESSSSSRNSDPRHKRRH